MSDAGNPPAGGDGGSGGTGDKSPTVTREAYERLLGERKSVGDRLKTLETELESFRAKEKAREEDEAKKKGEFETLVKQRDEELKKEREEKARLLAERVEARKYSAFVKGLGQAVDSRFAPLIDLEKIKVDADGNPDTESVTKYVADFKKAYPEVLKAPGGTPPPTPPGGGSTKLSHEEWLKLPLNERRKRMNDVRDD